MFSTLLQLHHHRHKEQQLLSAKSISEIASPPRPLQQQQKNTIDWCCISTAFQPASGRKDLAQNTLPSSKHST